jgi:16S rRNA (guanine966-N2)-methyltransferase
MGLEALSRGARFCQFVDDSTEARGLIGRNADALGLIGQCKIWRRDATRLGPCAPAPPFDLVFADPPYDKGLATKALAGLAEGGWIAPGGIVVVEESDRATVDLPNGLDELDRRLYGETQVIIARRSSAPAE